MITRFNYKSRKEFVFLDRSFDKGFVLNSYVFHGPSYTGKFDIAKILARKILCLSFSGDCGCTSCDYFAKDIHPDFHLIKKQEEKSLISINSIRDTVSKISMTPILSKKRVVLIRDGDLLSQEASNAILKTLEDTDDNVFFILSENLDRLLPTVISRSQIVNFSLLSRRKIAEDLVLNFGLGRVEALKLSSLSVGRPALSEKFHLDDVYRASYFRNNEILLKLLRGKKGEASKNLKDTIGGGDITSILTAWEVLLRDVVLSKSGVSNFLVNLYAEKSISDLAATISLGKIFDLFIVIKKIRYMLSRNVSPDYVLDYLIMSC